MSEIPSADWSWIHATAERFERAWKKGPRPRIEDFLATVGESFWPPLFEELLRVEYELRRRDGEEPVADDYRQRFPEHPEIVASVFRPRSSQPIPGGLDARLDSTLQTSQTSAARAVAIPDELVNHPDYEIVRELDRGGMGVVYLAHNRLMARDEVLKVMGREIVDKPGVMDRFLREIRAVAKLRHPNIVSAYSAFRCGASLAFAMEYVVGLDLRRMVKARGALPVANACSYVHQAALGLQHAHEEGMVHRDIKPGNLMLSHKKDRAVIKLLDFGLSKATSEQNASEVGISFSFDESDSGAHLTCTGQMLGTPDFIAPEQIDNSQTADIRADIYSLGCTLHFLLAGEPPYPDMTLGEVLRAHRSLIATRLDAIRKEVPPELASLVAKMMAKDPAKRFQEPAEVADALTPLFKRRGVSLKEPGTGPAVSGAESVAGCAPGEITKQALERFAFLSSIGDSTEAVGKPSAGNWPGLVETKDSTAADNIPARAPERPLAHVGKYWPLVASAIGLAVMLAGVIAWRIRPEARDRGGPKLAGVPASIKEVVTKPQPGQATPVDKAETGNGTPVKSAAVASGPKSEARPVASKAPLPPTLPATTPPEKLKSSLSASTDKPKSVTDKRRPIASPWRQVSPLGEQVGSAIDRGIRFLKKQQRPDGAWNDVEKSAPTGTTSLVTLALLSAGEKPDSPSIKTALDQIRKWGPESLRNTYAVSLQTMVLAEVEPAIDSTRIAANVAWLEKAQITARDRVPWPGTWTYSDSKLQAGDNSNTHWALLALNAASEAGAPVRPETWALARDYWERSQRADGSWTYTPAQKNSTASMTCAGIASLVITGLHRPRGTELIQGAAIRNCRQPAGNKNLHGGIEWLGENFHVDRNFGSTLSGQQWKFYYLAGLERAGRLAAMSHFGQHDWYRDGATELLRLQNKLDGTWTGPVTEQDRVLATSFAVLFLAKGRAPVLINKLRHLPVDDWNNDPDDVRNLVGVVARDRRTVLSSRVVDATSASMSELLQAPIAFLNGHRAPEFNTAAEENLRRYIEQGGYLFADACCDSPNFDRGFRELMKGLFHEEPFQLRPLGENHPVWRARHLISPAVQPLWGIDFGGRTAVIYSPKDLSCWWNQSERNPGNAAVTRAIKLGQNMIDYAIGLELPPDKLSVP
jgi:serine/threonine protein kinase